MYSSMASRRRAMEAAEKAVYKFDSEKAVVEYLYESKPPFLKCGYEHWIDKKNLQEDIKGLAEKFQIHGYKDRGLRLDYLQSVLEKKIASKPETFLILMKFLIGMSERPTAVLNFKVGQEKYSPEPDPGSSDEEINNQQEMLKKILFDGDKSSIDMHYSSDSDLSDWDLSEFEDDSEQRVSDNQEITNLRLSRSFSEFSQIISKAEDNKKDLALYWTMESIKSENYFSGSIRHVELVPLKNQPVISSLLSLQTKFGEYWEWKNPTPPPKKYVILEEDIIREILWQFALPNLDQSPIFSKTWTLKPEILVSTVSQSALLSFITKYGHVLSVLQDLYKFVEQVGNKSLCDAETTYGPPKMYKAYAHGLSEILLHISVTVDKIERNLKKENWKIEESQPVTTLLQMDKQLEECIIIIKALQRFHVHSIGSWDGDTDPNTSMQWYCSIRLISCLEMHLNLQGESKLFGIVLFLFSKCLGAFLEEIFTAMGTLEWKNNEFLFVRNCNVKLSAPNFWTEAVTAQPYEAKLKQSRIAPLSCLKDLVPNVLNVLKTLETLKQLDEDFKLLVSEMPSHLAIVCEFVNKVFETFPPQDASISNCNNEFDDPTPDFATHFKFLGLEGSVATESVQSILNEYERDKHKLRYNSIQSFELKRFLEINEVPVVVSGHLLNGVLKKTIYPFVQKSQQSVTKIFQNYHIDESMSMFREIILGGREDFAQAVVNLACKSNKSIRYQYEDEMNRNPRYQKLLNECYPEGRENFDIEFRLDSSSDMNSKFIVVPHFPLNLILTPKSIKGYLFVSRQLQRIRKSLWQVTALNIKDCRSIENVEHNRVLLFRFALIHFCSSIRAFLMLKIFTKDLSVCSKFEGGDIDSILRVHENYLNEIEMQLLRSRLIDSVIIRKMVSMSEATSKYWTKGIPMKMMTILEDTLKKCWTVVNDFSRADLSSDFTELSSHFGPPPGFL